MFYFKNCWDFFFFLNIRSARFDKTMTTTRRLLLDHDDDDDVDRGICINERAFINFGRMRYLSLLLDSPGYTTAKPVHSRKHTKKYTKKKKKN